MHDPVWVPDEAALGNAQVTFSFEAWSARKVSSSTFTISVVPFEEDKEEGIGG